MSYHSVVAASAPDHWWRLADPAGGLCHDIGSATPIACYLTGVAAQLAYTGPASDGGSAWFNSNTSAWHLHQHAFTSPYSMEIWFWRHFLSAATEALFELSNGAFTCGLDLNAVNGFIGLSGAAPQGGPASPPTENVWHYGVMTYGPTGGLKVYLDGVLGLTVAYAGVAAASCNIGLGIRPSGAGSALSHANLADAAFYSRELSAAEVSSHYAAADILTSRPVYRGAGTADLTTGGGSFTSTDSAAILKAVRKDFPAS